MSIDYYALVQKPVRVCYSMHECCICQGTIHYRQTYSDGGYGRRAHTNCLVAKLRELRSQQESQNP